MMDTPASPESSIIALPAHSCSNFAGFKLLYVFPEPLPLPRARGLQVAQSIRALAELGVKVILAYEPSNAGHPFVPIGQPIPSNVELLPLSRRLLGTRIQSNRFFMWRLARWLKSQKKLGSLPSIAFFRHVKAAAEFCRNFPTMPFVYEAHEVFSLTAKTSQRRRIRALEALVLEKAKLILANSKGSADVLKEEFNPRSKIFVLPNAVDYPENLPEKPWSESRQHLIYAGSLFGWKGVDDLVAAMGYLPEYYLTIIGGAREQIERLRIHAGSSVNRISFLGHLPQHEVQTILGRACVAILPNRADPDSAFTSPLKLFEYMAAGCAIVATDLPAIRELLGEDRASWAQPNDSLSLAKAIRRVCERADGGADLGAMSRDKVREYTWQNRGRELLRLIVGLCVR